MPLSPASRFGGYEIVSLLGAGGMGEVYRAKDLRLQRQVALKVLPSAVASDPERLARFEREAQVLASLNHPNIAAIYGVEDSTGTPALVMELVEGETLAERIARGPIPPDDALRIAARIAETLEAAHEHGIIHRDLKPANIKIRPDDTVKVLDFGLAKALDEGAGSAGRAAGTGADVTNSPTITSPAMTHVGVLLGTAGYMSPEQAKGKPADRRADIWAFGCVLFEMLAGRPAFHAEDVLSTIASVLTREPEWDALPASTPAATRKLLRRCLEKDAKRRLQAIGDARYEIEEISSGTSSIVSEGRAAVTTPVVVHGRSWLPWSIAAALAVALAVVVWRHSTEPAAATRRMQLTLPSRPETPTLFQAISPDARLAVLRYPEGLVVRSIETGETRVLTGTQGARAPFWSPDSSQLGYTSQADRTLNIVPAGGGRPQALCTGVNSGDSGTWSSDGTILFSSSGKLMRVPASGGSCIELPRDTSAHGEAFAPSFLPDGDHFIYVRATETDGPQIFLASLTDPVGRRLVREQSGAVFAPHASGSSSGWLLFVRPAERLLMAQAFDLRTLAVSGAPTVVAKEVAYAGGPPRPDVSAADDGTILYQTNADTARQLVWYDRSGAERIRGPLVGVGGGWVNLSPDGRRMAFSRNDAATPNAPGFLLAEFDGTRESRAALPTNSFPIAWAPDNERVAYVSQTAERVLSASTMLISSIVSAPPKAVVRNDGPMYLSDWSHDGTAIVYTVNDARTGSDIWTVPATSNADEAKPVALLNSNANESQGQLSPDGRWLAYYSDEAGVGQIYLRRFEAGGQLSSSKWQASRGGRAIEPRWRGDGKELYYLEIAAGGRVGKLVAVAIEPGTNPIGATTPLFDVRTATISPDQNLFTYSPAPDGQRFLVKVLSTRLEPSLEILFNWSPQ